jgi:hypothetical protein
MYYMIYRSRNALQIFLNLHSFSRYLKLIRTRSFAVRTESRKSPADWYLITSETRSHSDTIRPLRFEGSACFDTPYTYTYINICVLIGMLTTHGLIFSQLDSKEEVPQYRGVGKGPGNDD